MPISNLINGFADYKSLSSFFQNISKEMKKDGKCNLSGSALLEIFCKLDGVQNRRTIKSMFQKKEELKKKEEQSILFSNINSYSELKQVWIDKKHDQTFINDFFENRSSSDFSILDEPNYNKEHECFYIQSSIGDILFGETKKAPYFSELIETKDKKYFVSINKNPIVDEDPTIIIPKTFCSDNFPLTLKMTKMFVNKYVNKDYIDSLSDFWFMQEIRANKAITLEIKNKRIDKTNDNNVIYFKDEEIMSLLHKTFYFNKNRSEQFFFDAKEYFNQKDFYSIAAYPSVESTNNNSFKPVVLEDNLSFIVDAEEIIESKEHQKHKILCIIYKNEIIKTFT